MTQELGGALLQAVRPELQEGTAGRLGITPWLPTMPLSTRGSEPVRVVSWLPALSHGPALVHGLGWGPLL